MELTTAREEAALAAATWLDEEYVRAEAWHRNMYETWLKKLGGKCCECGEPAMEGGAMCEPCFDAWEAP